MKSLFLTVFLTATTLLIAQPDTRNTSNNNVDNNNTANTNVLQSIAGGSLGGQQYTGSATFFNPKFDREGTVYLFEYWDNVARIYAKNNAGAFNVSNINFNIQRSMFETKRRDSISSYNFANIEKMTVGNRVFKSYYFEPLKRHKVFEVIYEGAEFSILKGYTISILDANPNPMIARMRDKIIQRSQYYLDTEESLTEYKVNKRSIVKTLGPVKGVMAKEYAKKYQMSFTNEGDLKKILNYVKRQR